MGIYLSLIVAMLFGVSSVQAKPALKLEFSVDNELRQPQAAKQLFSDINWLQDQELAPSHSPTDSDISTSNLNNNSAFLQYQQVPQWRSSWRGGVNWQAQKNLMFKVKGNRLSGHLTVPTKFLCAICKTHLDTTVWKDGHVQLQLKSYFE
ncbi:hypothetical protein M0C34_01365 [Agarivorans sp. TSD2052]|uniref:hypothetical protein n=1 Tax=Agarivorans sp. TSD2052 TaxID=2937286 RepID=UPI00200E58BA|nr:hypothetical protein [Agarivorans sp. TSD2052]UPW18953.1 hypothetical protein M0C34_01365 [Agarivorans sp. TSD2052]